LKEEHFETKESNFFSAFMAPILIFVLRFDEISLFWLSWLINLKMDNNVMKWKNYCDWDHFSHFSIRPQYNQIFNNSLWTQCQLYFLKYNILRYFMSEGQWRPQASLAEFFFSTRQKTKIAFAYCLVYLSVRRSLSRAESLHFFLSLCSTTTMTVYYFPVWNIREAKIQWQITIANKKSRKTKLFFTKKVCTK
jgi:hypothetical protein